MTEVTDMPELKAALEALLFVADQPMRIDRLVEILESEKPRVQQGLDALMKEFAERDGGIVLEQVAGGYQFRTATRFAESIRKLSRSKPSRFSRAALETLAIVAYRQPITRAEIEYLRGVDSGGVVKTLLERKLIRILGKKEIPGRPLIYGTSRDFLEVFGLKDLSDLPSLKEFSELRSDLLEEGLAEEIIVEAPGSDLSTLPRQLDEA